MSETNKAVERVEALEKVLKKAQGGTSMYFIGDRYDYDDPDVRECFVLAANNVEFLCGALRAMAKVLCKTDRAFTPAKDGKEAIEIYEAQKAAVLEFRDGPYAGLLELGAEPVSGEKKKGEPNESSN